MYASNSQLLSQVPVQQAAMNHREVALAAADFDDIHVQVERNPSAPLPLKLAKVRSKQVLMEELKDVGVEFKA